MPSEPLWALGALSQTLRGLRTCSPPCSRLLFQNLFDYGVSCKLAEVEAGICRQNSIWDYLFFSKIQAKLGGKVKVRSSKITDCLKHLKYKDKSSRSLLSDNNDWVSPYAGPCNTMVQSCDGLYYSRGVWSDRDHSQYQRAAHWGHTARSALPLFFLFSSSSPTTPKV